MPRSPNGLPRRGSWRSTAPTSWRTTSRLSFRSSSTRYRRLTHGFQSGFPSCSGPVCRRHGTLCCARERGGGTESAWFASHTSAHRTRFHRHCRPGSFRRARSTGSLTSDGAVNGVRGRSIDAGVWAGSDDCSTSWPRCRTSKSPRAPRRLSKSTPSCGWRPKWNRLRFGRAKAIDRFRSRRSTPLCSIILYAC